jgi:hypothetical protein
LTGGAPLEQRLTEVAVYEVDDVPDPKLRILRSDGTVEYLPLTYAAGVAEAFFIAGEMPKADGLEIADTLRITEFRAFHVCFDDGTNRDLSALDILPEADKPAGRPQLLSADPFCPSGRFVMTR